MNKKLLIFSGIILFVFSFIIYEAIKLDRKFGDNASLRTGTILKTLPKVEFTKFGSPEKVTAQSITAEGNNVIIHFWATWCGPCEAEFPELVELIGLVKEKKNVKFLLVAVNDDKKKMDKFLSRFDLNLDNIVLLEDKTNAHKEFGTFKMPETFAFNTQNSIIKKFTGQQPWTQKYLVDFFKSL